MDFIFLHIKAVKIQYSLELVQWLPDIIKDLLSFHASTLSTMEPCLRVVYEMVVAGAGVTFSVRIQQSWSGKHKPS